MNFGIRWLIEPNNCSTQTKEFLMDKYADNIFHLQCIPYYFRYSENRYKEVQESYDVSKLISSKVN